MHSLLTQKQKNDTATCLGTWGCAAFCLGGMTGNWSLVACGASSFCIANEMVTGQCTKAVAKTVRATTTYMGMGTGNVPPPPAYVPVQQQPLQQPQQQQLQQPHNYALRSRASAKAAG